MSVDQQRDFHVTDVDCRLVGWADSTSKPIDTVWTMVEQSR